MDDEGRVGSDDAAVGDAAALEGAETIEGELSQELAVLHRVFRHDFRNRLNIVLGQAERARNATDDPELAAYLDDLLVTADALVDTVDQVSLIQTLASGDESPEVVDIGPTLRELIDEYDRPGVTVEGDVPGSVWVWMNPTYENAFRELIENAVVHNDAATPRVSVDVTHGATTDVRIADNGSGMPAGTKAHLEATAVDQTDHLGSLGLWTAYWVITRSGGTLSIDETESGGCEITIRLRAASSPDS